MDIQEQIKWLKPDRILKLYDGEKNMPGMNRLLIVGVGQNGVDCLIRAKHIAENRFNKNTDKIRFLAIAEDEYLRSLDCHGSTLSEDEMIGIDPEEAIFKYLNNPDLLSPYALEWFDQGLKNYSPNPPKYGLLKRQGGRIALFHYIEPLLKRLGKLINNFSGSESPLEISVVGNMGGAFFGGMVIDLGYILTSMFTTDEYPVKVNSYMFVGDTTQLFRQDARDLANYYANTILTKGELDLFQCRKRQFSQKYSDTFEIKTDKPPFNACYIASAEKTYKATLVRAAEKILSEAEFIYKKDDDAEKATTFNLLDKNGSHGFRYLAYDVSGVEIPLGKIVSYLSIKLFGSLCEYLRQNSVGLQQLGLLTSKVTPDAMLLASRAGAVPKLEFDEKYNPLFSMRSLKNGGEATRRYVMEKTDEFAEFVKKGAEIVAEEAPESIIAACEDALKNFEKGPFCAQEIIRKCLSELKNSIKKTEEDIDDIEEQMQRQERLVQTDYRKLKSTPAMLAGNAARMYVASLSDYANYLQRQKTLGTMLNFYNKVYAKLEDYSKNVLDESVRIFSLDATEFLGIVESGENDCMREAFDVNSPEILKKLDKLVEDIPETTRMLAFKRMKMMSSEDASGHQFASEIVNLAAQCFGAFLLMSYNDFCEYLGVESSIGEALRGCFANVEVKTPTENSEPITRAVCPQNIKQGDIAPLKASRQGMNYIWNVSPMFNAAVIVQIKGGVKFDGFRDYNQWENMRYAYVNDSLKKHGIHIFKA